MTDVGQIERITQLRIVKLFVEPEDVAKMVAFLFSDDSSYSTASQLVTDGGVVG